MGGLKENKLCHCVKHFGRKDMDSDSICSCFHSSVMKKQTTTTKKQDRKLHELWFLIVFIFYCVFRLAQRLLVAAWQQGTWRAHHTPGTSLKYIPRRAVLYVPGNDERKLRKLTALNVDCAVLDCEDGVALNKKVPTASAAFFKKISRITWLHATWKPHLLQPGARA